MESSLLCGLQVQVSCTYIEVYNNTVRDLLEGTSDISTDHPLHQRTKGSILIRDPELKGDVVMVGVVEGAELQ